MIKEHAQCTRSDSLCGKHWLSWCWTDALTSGSIWSTVLFSKFCLYLKAKNGPNCSFYLKKLVCQGVLISRYYCIILSSTNLLYFITLLLLSFILIFLLSQTLPNSSSSCLIFSSKSATSVVSSANSSWFTCHSQPSSLIRLMPSSNFLASTFLTTPSI